MKDNRGNEESIRFVEDDNFEKYDKRPSHRKSRTPSFFKLFLSIVIIAAAIYIFLMAFHVKEVEIKGTNYSTNAQIEEWLDKEKGKFNSVYAFIRINYMKQKFPPAVENIHVSILKPDQIRLTVKEKEPAGYIDYLGGYLCFDSDGIAMAAVPAGTYIENAAYIEGMEIDESKVDLGDILPVSDDKVFKQIVQVNHLLEKYDLSPEGITCSGTDINLYFPFVEVLLGKSDYENRIAQLPPILKKLAENYPAVEGTLHLEKFDVTDKSVRFVPKTGR